MRLFVQAFEQFGEEPSKISNEEYLVLLSRIDHIKQFLGLDYSEGNFTKERYKEICSSYRGSFNTDWGISVKPGGEMIVEYDVFHTIEGRTKGQRYVDRCRLRIWLTKQDVFKLMEV